MSGQTPKNGTSSSTGLLLFSGEDKPGIAAGIFSALSPFSVKVIDLEQLRIGDRTIFAMLILLDPAHASVIESDLTISANNLQLDFACQITQHTETLNNSQSKAKIILVGNSFTPIQLHKVTSVVTKHAGNIERIVKIADSPVLSMEFLISLPAERISNLRLDLTAIGIETKLAISLLDESRVMQSRKLFIFDIDSTLIQEEVIDLLAVRANVGDEVALITAAAMRGELDFSESLTKRVALLAGLSETVLTEIQGKIHLSSGAQNLIKILHSQGHILTAVSGGFIDVIKPLMDDLGFHHYRANKLEIISGKLSGKLVGQIVDANTKAQALVEFARITDVPISQTIAIGDGANDLEMIKLAGVGIAYNAKPILQAAADIVLNIKNLDAIIYLLGLSNLDVTGGKN